MSFPLKVSLRIQLRTSKRFDLQKKGDLTIKLRLCFFYLLDTSDGDLGLVTGEVGVVR